MRWTDCHVHVLDGGLEALEDLARSQKDFGYDRSNLLSVEGMGNCAQNALAIAFKILSPDHYAFGSLHYRFPYDFAGEAQALWDLGLDGIKMIENKPTERKLLGYRQDDGRYDGFYETLQALDIPVLAHVNDPRDFWDPDKAPQWAVDAGYAYCDGTFVPFAEILEESVRMLEKWPKLRVCFAHLMFLSDDGPALRQLMERHPNMYLDITSGTEMYVNFSEDLPFWRRFFLDFSDRILYGTDNCDRPNEHEREIGRTINAMQKRFLTTADIFPLWDSQIRGLDLPGEVLEKICAGNFSRFAGEKPRPLDKGKALRYLENRLDDPRFRLTAWEAELIGKVCEKLS